LSKTPKVSSPRKFCEKVQKFLLSLNSLKKLKNSSPKKLLTKKWKKNGVTELSLLIVKVTYIFYYNFFGGLFQGFNLRIKLCVRRYSNYKIYKEKMCVTLFSTFLELQNKTHPKWLKKGKIAFYTFVLDLNLVFTTASVFFICLKKAKITVPQC
jgi:hypothetical protein